MRHKSIIELTPLIDVFLILIFAFLINTRQTEDQQRLETEMLKHQVEILQHELADNQDALERYRSSLDASELRTKDYEQQLSEQKAILDTTIWTVSEKLAVFIESADLSLRFSSQMGEISEEDYQNFQQQINRLELDDAQHIIEKIYILGELEAYSSQMAVYLGDGNNVFLDHEPTGLSLDAYDEALDDFPEAAKARFSKGVYDYLQQQYANRKKGDNKLGEVVLITFGHASEAMRGAIQLTEEQVATFFRDVERRESGTRKVFYSRLGFYPFSPRAQKQ